MPPLRSILLVVLILMSLSAGIAKLLQMPQEVTFFESAGLGLLPLISLGVLQVVASVFASAQRWRQQGLWLVAIGFLASCAVILTTGNVAFATASLIPVILSLYLSISKSTQTPG